MQFRKLTYFALLSSTSFYESFLISGKLSIGPYVPTTPKTPSYPRPILAQMSANRTGPSPSAERASILVAKAPRKDTRPISEKYFQSQMLKKIDDYFTAIQQSTLLNSNGSLKPITIKLFVEVSGLLVGLLGMKQTLTNLNYVEELPKVAKKLQYPGPMAKSWMKSANAMHAWPNVLAWLSWLVEMCELRDIAAEQFRIENLPFTNVDGEAERHRNMFFSMLKFYNAWNEEREIEEILVAEFLKAEEARLDVNDETYENARVECEAAMLELEKEDELRTKIDLETKQLQDLLDALKEDEQKILDYNCQQDEHIKNLTEECQQIKKDCRVLDDEIEKQHMKQNELRVIIKKQPISPKERDEILAKCDDVRKYLNQFEEHLQVIQKDVYSQDMKLASVNHNLNKIILEYNRDIHNYLDAISDINVADIQIPENVVSDPHSMVMLQEISKSLTSLKEKMKKEFEELEALIEPNAKRLENLQEKAKMLAEDNLELEKKSKEKKVKVNEIKAQAKIHEAELRENIKSLEQSIKSIQDSRPDLKSKQNELIEKVDKRDSLERRKIFLEKRAHNFFDKIYGILSSHRKECLDLFEKVKKVL